MEKQSLTATYVIMFDYLPPLLETMDYENDFYQDLMGEAIINEKPITEETIEKALEEKNIKYDTAENYINSNFKRFKKQD